MISPEVRKALGMIPDEVFEKLKVLAAERGCTYDEMLRIYGKQYNFINYRPAIANSRSVEASMIRERCLRCEDGIAWEALQRVVEQIEIPD
ncbi:hypothetical protein FXW07_07220 [Methanosarcina sp. DH1]|uniref:hypothetical protein n=1 Tax=Methanosarcina sp. DH1 TaxID=2605695 RepID=UPI001E534BC0|nr:hypothetical protein [Methanosarcina sp. DH1]MCC4766410.1 hypothetical protein [Methanosarcina sp. DH1]